MVILVATLLALALGVLLWRDRRSKPPPGLDRLAQDRQRPLRRRPAKRPEILVDGSNVMHWQDNRPDIGPLRAVVAELQTRGFTPGVIFDANAGYKLFGRYCDDPFMARALGLPEAQVLVVPKGEPADRFLLEVSRRRQAPIVTCDRFRDWAEAYPEIQTPGRLIRGGLRDGAIWLAL